MARRHMALLAVLVGMLAACRGGERAAAPAEAFDDHAAERARALLHADAAYAVVQVEPAPERLGGRALIAVPDRALIEAAGLRASAPRDPRARRYLADVVEVGLLAEAEGLRRADLFDVLTVVRDGDPGAVAIGDYDVKIWLRAETSDRWAWFVARNGVDTAPAPVPVPVPADGDPAEPERLVGFAHAVLAACVTLGLPTQPRP
jgi:hypothetical protein